MMDLGKILFSKHPKNRRSKEMTELIIVLTVTVLLCALVGVGLYLINLRGHA